MSRHRDRIASTRIGAVASIALAGMLACAWPPAMASAQDWPSLGPFAGPNCFAAFWEGELEIGPRIVASRQPLQISFGPGEIVYLEGPGATALEPGTYRVVRLESASIATGEEGRDFGQLVSFVGDLTVVDVDDERALAEIGLACQAIEVGDFIGPPIEAELPEIMPQEQFDPAHLITPVPEDATVLFGAVETLMAEEEGGARIETESRQTYAAGDAVTIDRGAGDGWHLGDVVLFYLPHAEDVYQVAGEVAAPPRLAARGVVFWAQAHSSTVMITDGDQPVTVGTRGRRIVDPGE